MNPMAQPGTHPDADLLNAFAERALPEVDRVRVMSHLAECARCREIAYLAQAAAEEEVVPAPVIAPQPSWLSAAFARWRVALIPAAALAAVGVVVLWVQLHPAPRPAEMAQLTRQLAPVLPPTPPQTAVTGPNRLKTEPAAPRSSSASVKARTVDQPGEDQPKAAVARPPVPSQDQTAAFASASAPGLTSPTAQSRAQGGIHLDGRSAALARFAPLPPNAPPPLFPGPASQQPSVVVSPESRAALAAPARAPAPAPTPPGLFNAHGELVSASTLGPSQVAAQSLQQAELVPPSMDGLPVLRLAKRAKLPSGLNTVSSAVLLNRLVAIDSAGAVFLSQDGGKRWEPVRPQWKGRAIQVQPPQQAAYRLMSTSENRSQQLPPHPAQASIEPAQETANTPSAAPPPDRSVSSSLPSTSSAKAALAGPPLLFTLVTDHHEVWTSPDGKTWSRQ